ncbi:hypothetical protein chiPu_0023646 [Chiloscyllium punctatum]|uniref:Uncharacterized protein n=1 Tax=Chiloscyllium punctatum TaxID=137246 RepID=A0A401TAT4_CHIPU|nr:hypothetical protein [Chiloscyllium punctatum]
MEEGISEESTRCEAQQDLEEALVFGGVRLDRDEEQDEERGGTDQYGRSNSLPDTDTVTYNHKTIIITSHSSPSALANCCHKVPHWATTASEGCDLKSHSKHLIQK